MSVVEGGPIAVGGTGADVDATLLPSGVGVEVEAPLAELVSLPHAVSFEAVDPARGESDFMEVLPPCPLRWCVGVPRMDRCDASFEPLIARTVADPSELCGRPRRRRLLWPTFGPAVWNAALPSPITYIMFGSTSGTTKSVPAGNRASLKHAANLWRSSSGR